jgi:hypothetical protein
LGQGITRTKATRVVHPTYPLDAAPNDFFSFGYLKGEMADFTADSLTDILSEIPRSSRKSQNRPSWLCMASG